MDGGFVEWDLDTTLGIDAFGDAKGKVAGQIRVRVIEIDIVTVGLAAFTDQ